MATRIITLSTSYQDEGFAWSVNFSADDATNIIDINNFSITCSTNTAGNFNVVNAPTNKRQGVNGYSTHYSSTSAPFGGAPNTAPTSSDDSYVTWRSLLTNGQYPTSGRSMDIWSVDFYTDLMYNGGTYNKTWGSINNGTTYSLNPRKWSLIYDYSARTAFVWSKGGILTVNVV